MSEANFSESFTSSSKSTLNIPANADNINILVKSGSGGNGGDDSDDDGGDGLGGREGEFKIRSDFEYKKFQLRIWVGSQGQNGGDNKTGSGGGSRGQSGNGRGGEGGDAAPYPYSGGGGGGGGASVVEYSDPTGSEIIIVAGGGGGGSGASKDNDGKDGSAAPSFKKDILISVSPGTDGQTLKKCNGSPNDGGGGGGGGGGAPGGAGGIGGSDDNFCDIRAEGGEAGGSKFNNIILKKNRDDPADGNGNVTVSWRERTPEIDEFYADPEDQFSLLGTPKYDVDLYWSGKDYDWAGIRKIKKDGNIISPERSFDEITSSPVAIDDLTQSNADGGSGNISPRSFKWQLKLCIGGENGVCVTQGLTVKIKNDNKATTDWTKTFDDLEPLETVEKKMGKFEGIDMPTIVKSGDSGVQFSNFKSFGYDNPKLMPVNSDLYIRTTTLDWNTDLTGIGVNAEYGKKNVKTVSVEIGGKSPIDVKFKTKAPKIKETFDYSDQEGRYPEPDIDLIDNDQLIKDYIETNIQKVDDIDIPMQFKSSNPNIQISVNNGNWKYVKNLNPKSVD